MEALRKLFGPTLMTKDGEKPTAEVLDGKTAVGLYFSAREWSALAAPTRWLRPARCCAPRARRP